MDFGQCHSGAFLAPFDFGLFLVFTNSRPMSVPTSRPRLRCLKRPSRIPSRSATPGTPRSKGSAICRAPWTKPIRQPRGTQEDWANAKVVAPDATNSYNPYASLAATNDAILKDLGSLRASADKE